ncbi:MAG: hypothetical protein RBS55_08850 [Bacteroidales bacterium]|jgi:hypothetical protein|nr:hypothetical protein [Bacteroidales bacterium]
MKQFIAFIIGSICLLFFTVSVNSQWAYNGTHIYNTNAGNVGIVTNAPGTLLDVAKSMTEPTIRVYNLGGNGGATYQMKDALSGADWKFKATNLGGFKIRDHALGLDVMVIEQNSAANCIYIQQGGNVGIGTNSPLEKLDVNGAVRIGNTANSNAGAIKWDGTNFLGYNGTSWINLDFTWNDPWILAPNVPVGNPEFSSGPQPMSLSFAFPGIPNPTARLYLTDMSAPGIFPHLLTIETITAGAAALNASQLFRISANMNPPFNDYSLGIFGGDGTFKLTFGSTLLPTAQGDNSTMIRSYPGGIIDFPNQSRVRAYQLDPNGFVQVIPPNIWTPVNFTSDAPLIAGYDEQNEFTVAPGANVAVPPEQAFFMALTEGYYQVNARCEFAVYMAQVMPGSYISIAIYTGPFPGATAPYAIGNNLAIATFGNMGEPVPLEWNNAPNVSDVVYLMPGQIISIWVYHNALNPLNLIQGLEKCYVSIHKVS